jgi:hypothetical protein
MPLEIECSDLQPGDFQRIPFLHTFSVTKKDKKPLFDELATL